MELLQVIQNLSNSLWVYGGFALVYLVLFAFALGYVAGYTDRARTRLLGDSNAKEGNV